MTNNNISNNTNVNDSINNNAVTTNNNHFNSNSINNLQTHSSAFNNNNNGCNNLYNSNTNNINNSSNIKTNNTPNRTILSLNVNNLPLICFNKNIAKQSNNNMLTSNNIKNNSNIINDIANVSSNIGNNNSSSNNGSINNIINQNANNCNTLCFPPSLAPIGYISTSSPVVTPISFLFPHQRQLSMFKRANRRLSYMDHVCNSIFNSINRYNNIKKINIVADNISGNTGSNNNNARNVNNINHRNFSSNNNNINNIGLNSNNNFIDSLCNINSINKICSNVNDDNNGTDVNQSVDPNSFEYLLKQDFIFPVKVIPNEVIATTCCICCDSLQNESSYANETQKHHEQQQSWSVVFLDKCRHHFHLLCLKAMYEAGTKHGSLQCPHCKHIYGVKVGNCPAGRMVCVTIPQSLPGYEQYDTLYITYNILSGVQEPGHPNPGKKYSARGFPRCGYLPNNKKGQKVLRLLVKAWNRRLTFTIGTSVTTGESNTVVWNEIHHKTEMLNKHGHGYPDANYLDNVISELAAQGVIDDNADDDDADDDDAFLND
ncbi:hypothetical protein HELRODRAFT_191022 [Helobdella robusta]|uniref:E3 ubiquitin-protein ligase n=1 Tax=Helobdella robusta TaxID=6412 RepID=T1FSI4_HELRO|nr:hypothetical protein HELRODRAFT_191022 [Helobdella robusta]ESO07728.1 hypothetical protein HELRODRAFT_191022 [Helobdella robusta]